MIARYERNPVEIRTFDIDVGQNANDTDADFRLAILEFNNTNGVDLGFITSDAIHYDIESRTNLMPGADWTPIRSVVGDGFYRELNATNSAGARQFFRVRTDVPALDP